VKGLYIVTDGVTVGMLLGEGAVYCDRWSNGRDVTG
jgi:hypothetical protein